MDITTATLCDFAQVRDRLLFISSAGVSRLYRKELPSHFGVNLALVIEVPLSDAGIPQTMAVRVVNRHGAEMSHISTTFRVGDEGLFPNEIQQVPMVVSLAQTPIRSWGTHQVRIFLNGELVRTVTCYVVPSSGVLSPAPAADAATPEAPAVTPAEAEAEAEAVEAAAAADTAAADTVDADDADDAVDVADEESASPADADGDADDDDDADAGTDTDDGEDADADADDEAGGSGTTSHDEDTTDK